MSQPEVERRNTFFPFGAITGVGSLPHENVEEALDCVFRYCPEIPFSPQLGLRMGKKNMLSELFLCPSLARYITICLNGQLRLSEDVDISKLSAAFSKEPDTSDDLGIMRFQERFLQEKKSHPSSFLAVKGQLVGPITFLLNVLYRDRPILFSRELSTFFVEHLLRQALWQVSRLQKLHQKVILFLDEPSLGVLGQADIFQSPLSLETLREMTAQVISCLQEKEVLVGVHCCSSLWGAFIEGLNFDILSFDVCDKEGGLGSILFRPFVKDLLDRGGILSLGVIPTVLSLMDHFDPMVSTEKVIGEVEKTGLDFNQVLKQSLVTSTCGLGMLNEDYAIKSFILAREVSQRLREKLENL